MVNAALAQLVGWVAPRRLGRAPSAKYGHVDAERRRRRALAVLRHYDTFTTVQAAELLDLGSSATTRVLRAWHKAGIVKQVTAGAGSRVGVWKVVK